MIRFHSIGALLLLLNIPAFGYHPRLYFKSLSQLFKQKGFCGFLLQANTETPPHPHAVQAVGQREARTWKRDSTEVVETASDTHKLFKDFVLAQSTFFSFFKHNAFSENTRQAKLAETDVFTRMFRRSQRSGNYGAGENWINFQNGFPYHLNLVNYAENRALNASQLQLISGISGLKILTGIRWDAIKDFSSRFPTNFFQGFEEVGFDFQGCNDGSYQEKAWQEFLHLSFSENLRGLRFDHVALTPKRMKQLVEILNRYGESIERVSFTSSYAIPQEEVWRIFAEEIRLPHLKTLEISFCGLNATNFETLLKSATIQKLEYLDVSENSLRSSALASLVGAARPLNWVGLNIRRNFLLPNDLNRFSASQNLERLRYLYIDEIPETGALQVSRDTTVGIPGAFPTETAILDFQAFRQSSLIRTLLDFQYDFYLSGPSYQPFILGWGVKDRRLEPRSIQEYIQRNREQLGDDEIPPPPPWLSEGNDEDLERIPPGV